MKLVTGLALGLVLPMVLIIGLALLTSTAQQQETHDQKQAEQEQAANAGGDVTAKVPEKYRHPIRKAAQTCKSLSPGLLGAQIHTETGFHAHATSPAGAKGPAQFKSETWKRFKTDGDGDGTKDIDSVPDAVAGQGRYMCHIAKQVKTAKKNKKVHGSLTKLMLAAYNAGTGTVLKSHGVPSSGEPHTYVAEISDNISRYGTTGAGDDMPSVKGGSLQAKAIKHAHKELGTPYSFGGGTPKKPTVGRTKPAGWDCSSYVQMAYYRASHGKINLQPPTGTQKDDAHFTKITGVKTSLDKSKLKPGDVIYVDTDGNWGHVVLYEGKGKIIEEPHTGAKSRVKPLGEYADKDKTVRRVKT